MHNVKEIVSDEVVDKVWENANFGSQSKRDVIKYTLLKCAGGYRSGHTESSIMRELGLIKISKWELTKKGQKYLFAAFSDGNSI